MLRRLFARNFNKTDSVLQSFLQQKITRNISLYAGNALSKLKAESVAHNDKQGQIKVTWENKRVSHFPYVFLRDNCQCPACYHPRSGQRFVLIGEAMESARRGVKNVDLKHDQIRVKWACGHESEFSLEWLKDRGFVDDMAKRRKQHPVRGFQNILWKSDHNVTFIEFDAVMKDDQVLYKWMKTLLTEGICILRNAATETGQLKVLASRSCGKLLSTMYGEVFTVQDKPSANNLGYTAGFLPLHTDQPYYCNQPGLQFLHCIVPSVEGEGINHLVDGFKVAHDFREQNPKEFDILSTLTFPYEQDGNEMFGEFQLYADQTIIGLNQHGQVDRISHSNAVKASTMNHSPEGTKQLYYAVEKFVALMYDEEYLVEYRLEAGDVLCLNNRRILHGRTSYDATRTKRWLEGAYMNWDDLCARVRPLKYKYENDL